MEPRIAVHHRRRHLRVNVGGGAIAAGLEIRVRQGHAVGVRARLRPRLRRHDLLVLNAAQRARGVGADFLRGRVVGIVGQDAVGDLRGLVIASGLYVETRQLHLLCARRLTGAQGVFERLDSRIIVGLSEDGRRTEHEGGDGDFEWPHGDPSVRQREISERCTAVFSYSYRLSPGATSVPDYF